MTGGDTSGRRAKYDRIASFYDSWDSIPERLFYNSWRRRLWSGLAAGSILEIGVGTGKNIPFYPSGSQVTAIDLSPKMLETAVRRATTRQDVSVRLLEMDVNALSLDDHSFDAVVGSFILMVLPDPLRALQEIARVCKPGAMLRLLEFTRSDNKLAALMQNLLTPVNLAVYGAHLNRELVKLVESSGFREVTAEAVGDGVVKIIQAVR